MTTYYGDVPDYPQPRPELVQLYDNLLRRLSEEMRQREALEAQIQEISARVNSMLTNLKERNR